MTTNTYSTARIALHWTIAVTLTGALASGIAFGNGAAPALVPHIAFGAATGVFALARLAVWLFAPGPVPPKSNLPARVVHWVLALGPLGQLVSGIVMLALTGALARIASGAPPSLQDFAQTPPAGPHGAIGIALGALALGHVALALWHQFGKGDRLIARMGRG